MAHEVFVSYAAPDKRIADAIVAYLEQGGSRCWMAPRDITAGTEWAHAIVEAIAGSQLMVLVVSGHANESPQIVRCVEQASSEGIPVLPFRVEDVEPSAALGYFIGGSHWLDAIHPPMDAHLERLAQTVRALAHRDPSDAEELSPISASTKVADGSGTIAVGVVQADALDFAADALALKHADGAFYGVDKAVAARYLDRLGLPFPVPERIGEGLITESRRCVAAARIIVVRVPALFDFGHREIRRFAAATMQTLHSMGTAVSHLALTIQGAALLLDEAAVLETQLGGLIDALDDGFIPQGLERITFVERSPDRAAKLDAAVQRVLPEGVIPIRDPLEPVSEEPASPDVDPDGTAAPFPPYTGREPYLFVSYAHADSKEVFQHLGELHNAGYRIWYDGGIAPGTNWEDSIADAIAGAEQVLVCLTPRSAVSQHVRDEVSYALNKDKPFLAAYFEETDLPPGLELRIGNKQAIMAHRQPKTAIVNAIARSLTPHIRSSED